MFHKITFKCDFTDPSTDEERRALLMSMYGQSSFKDTAILIMEKVKAAKIGNMPGKSGGGEGERV